MSRDFCLTSSVLLVSRDVGGFSASRPARDQHRFNPVPAVRLGTVQGFIRSPNYLIGVRHRPSRGGNTNAHSDRQRRGVAPRSEPAYGGTGMSPSPSERVASLGSPMHFVPVGDACAKPALFDDCPQMLEVVEDLWRRLAGKHDSKFFSAATISVSTTSDPSQPGGHEP